MKECHHLFTSEEIREYYAPGSKDCYNIKTCCRCGVVNNIDFPEFLTLPKELHHLSERIYEQTIENSIKLDNEIFCDHRLAKGIYLGIIENIPDISDELLYDYFKKSLYNIRTKKPSPKSRPKRLGLRNNFKDWNKLDAIHMR